MLAEISDSRLVTMQRYAKHHSADETADQFFRVFLSLCTFFDLVDYLCGSFVFLLLDKLVILFPVLGKLACPRKNLEVFDRRFFVAPAFIGRKILFVLRDSALRSQTRFVCRKFTIRTCCKKQGKAKGCQYSRDIFHPHPVTSKILFAGSYTYTMPKGFLYINVTENFAYCRENWAAIREKSTIRYDL